MALSEFRYNRKKGHYTYIYGKKGAYRKFLVLTSKSHKKRKSKNGKVKNVPNILLYEHPNPNKKGVKQFVENKVYKGNYDDFNRKLNWSFHKYDKRKIKRIIKRKW